MSSIPISSAGSGCAGGTASRQWTAGVCTLGDCTLGRFPGARVVRDLVHSPPKLCAAKWLGASAGVPLRTEMAVGACACARLTMRTHARR